MCRPSVPAAAIVTTLEGFVQVFTSAGGLGQCHEIFDLRNEVTLCVSVIAAPVTDPALLWKDSIFQKVNSPKAKTEKSPRRKE